MTKTGNALALWAPRAAGIAMAVFLVPFAAQAFNERPFAEAVPAFLMNLLPALFVIASVAVGWRHPRAGAAGFALFAIVYAALTPGRLDWIAVISGPLAVVAGLFLLSSRLAAKPGATR